MTRRRLWFPLLPFVLSGCSNAFVEWETREDGGKNRAVRPIFSYEHERFPQTPDTAPGVRSRGTFLWPLGHYRADLATSTFRFFPFYMRHARANEKGPDWDSATLLLLWRGSDPADGPYTGLFPLGGTFKNLFFKDRVDFFLFPLYARVRENASDSHNLLWPFFNATGGEVRGWKAWPLYGRYRKENEAGTPLYDRRFWLWPFFTWHRNNLDLERPASLFFFFPFYGRSEGPSLSQRTVLWPFFRHRVERGHSPREDWRAPWPFVQVGDGKDYRRRDFWPVYGRLTTGKLDRTWWLWPIFRDERQVSEESATRRSFVIPFYWHVTEQGKDGETTLSRFKLWPFYGKRLEKDGSRQTEALSLLWFTDPGGLESAVAPFWRLYWHAKSPAGEERLAFGFRLLYDGRRAGPDVPYDWNVLGGLFGRATTDGKRRTRFLYHLW